MSLHIKAIDRLFERLGASYGAQWTRQWQDVPMADVKTAWAHELDVFSNSLHRVAWALENLPPKCPNSIEFKNLCRQAPAPEVPRLPEPKADPERVKSEISKLGELRAKVSTGAAVDHKAWAKRIMARYHACEQSNPTTLRFAREALGLVKQTEAA
jgi:hypothetical protein